MESQTINYPCIVKICSEYPKEYLPTFSWVCFFSPEQPWCSNRICHFLVGPAPLAAAIVPEAERGQSSHLFPGPQPIVQSWTWTKPRWANKSPAWGCFESLSSLGGRDMACGLTTLPTVKKKLPAAGGVATSSRRSSVRHTSMGVSGPFVQCVKPLSTRKSQ